MGAASSLAPETTFSPRGQEILSTAYVFVRNRRSLVLTRDAIGRGESAGEPIREGRGGQSAGTEGILPKRGVCVEGG
jgi:hypothetical protein